MSRTFSTFWMLCGLALTASMASAAESESDALARARTANQAKDFATSVAIYQDWSRRGSAEATRFLGLM